MTLHRFPILVWRDYEGFHHASVVEWCSELVGIDETASKAVRRVKQWLKWRYQTTPWMDEPDFTNAQLQHVQVSIRPQYQRGDRSFPCDHHIDLRVPCVTGKEEGGGLVCALPTLGIRFDYFSREALKRLVVERTRSHLANLEPSALARYLPPTDVRLEEISVKTPSKPPTFRAPLHVEALQKVAEPLGRPDVRRRYNAAWQREDEVRDLVARLQQEGSNVLLVGEAGVGKTTTLVAAVRNIERRGDSNKESDDDRDVTKDSRHRFRHWFTSGARLIAGMKYLGEWQERCEQIVEELAGINGVLCVDRLLDLVRLGGKEPNDSLAAFFLPYLSSGELRMVGEATPSELVACRRLLPGFADLFQSQTVVEMNLENARAALKQLATSQSRNLKVEVEEPAIDAACRLFRRFMPYEALPGRATPFLTNLMTQARQFEQPELKTADVLGAFIHQTGLPSKLIRDDETLAPDEVLAYFQQQVIGQESGCRAAAQLVANFKASLNDPARPVGVMLFCGPTGVGKTELAKTISSYLFGHGGETERLLRVDMSEYSSWDAADRLVRKATGGPSDFLTKVRSQPFRVVLLDEIEKAHADVFDLLLGLLDEGRLSDRFGRTTNFRSTIIIMTSNLGVTSRSAVGFDSSTDGLSDGPSHQQRSQGFEKSIRAFFRPEFFNRIDQVVTFNSLNREVCRAIIEKQLGEMSSREGLLSRRINLQWTPTLVDRLTTIGFDSRYGARPLNREIEARITAPLARFLVANLALKDVTLSLDFESDELKIER